MSTRETPWPVGAPAWVDLLVHDIDAALEFYGKVTNWTFLDTGADSGHYRMCQVDDRNATGIGAAMSPDQPVAWTIYFATEDIDATAKLIGENGGSLLLEPMAIGEVCSIAVATDNQGAVFGVYQAGTSIGNEVVEEPGAPVWVSGAFQDVPKARDFYGAVVGHGFQRIPPMEQDFYGGFTAGGELAGGIGGMMGAPEDTPSSWTVFFEVADVDAAVAAALEGGATVVQPAEDTPHGRMSTVVDPFGAVVGLHGANNEQGEGSS